MSRASWKPFEDELHHLLVSRHVPPAAATAIALELVDECARYLLRRRFEVGHDPRPTLRQMLLASGSLADRLRTTISRLRIFTTQWTRADQANLEALLEKLSTATQAANFRPRPGIKPDVCRHALEENVAGALTRHGVRVTTAKAGTFGLVLEQVHAAVGIAERDVHKSVRRAHSALKAAQKAT